MDIHPWTKYEMARLHDEERLLRARDAMRARELRDSDVGDVGVGARAGSWLGRLRRREPVADQGSVRPRPV
jgi:hypothetical protein